MHPIRLRQLIFVVQLVTKIYSPQPAVGVHFDADRLHVGRLKTGDYELGQVHVQLVPTYGHRNRHRDHKRAQLFFHVVTAHA